jgi:hypothetical protein
MDIEFYTNGLCAGKLIIGPPAGSPNDVSRNDISPNDVSPNDVSPNDVSPNDVSPGVDVTFTIFLLGVDAPNCHNWALTLKNFICKQKHSNFIAIEVFFIGRH